jgi:hypothetical protein
VTSIMTQTVNRVQVRPFRRRFSGISSSTAVLLFAFLVGTLILPVVLFSGNNVHGSETCSCHILSLIVEEI